MSALRIPPALATVLDETESEYDERGVFADAMDEWTGIKRNTEPLPRLAVVYFINCCHKHNVETNTNVTFLSACAGSAPSAGASVAEPLHQGRAAWATGARSRTSSRSSITFIAHPLLAERGQAEGRDDAFLSYVYRRVAAPPSPGRRAMTIHHTQRSKDLPPTMACGADASSPASARSEFNLNVFFDRLVRVFSESFQQMLSRSSLSTCTSFTSTAHLSGGRRGCASASSTSTRTTSWGGATSCGARRGGAQAASCASAWWPPDGWPHGSQEHGHVVLTLADQDGIETVTVRRGALFWAR